MLLAFANRRLSSHVLQRSWGVSFAANAGGALLLVLAIYPSGVVDAPAVKATTITIAEAKAQLGAASAFLRDVVCNTLVRLAV